MIFYFSSYFVVLNEKDILFWIYSIIAKDKQNSPPEKPPCVVVGKPCESITECSRADFVRKDKQNSPLQLQARCREALWVDYQV